MPGPCKYSVGMRSQFVTILWALLLVLLPAPQLPGQISAPTQDALVEAQQLFRKADFRAAADAFRKVIDARPSAEAYAGLVQSLLKADDVKAAEDISQKALRLFLNLRCSTQPAEMFTFGVAKFLKPNPNKVSAQAGRKVAARLAGAGKS